MQKYSEDQQCEQADEHPDKKINGSAGNVFITDLLLVILAKNLKTNKQRQEGGSMKVPWRCSFNAHASWGWLAISLCSYTSIYHPDWVWGAVGEKKHAHTPARREGHSAGVDGGMAGHRPLSPGSLAGN